MGLPGLPCPSLALQEPQSVHCRLLRPARCQLSERGGLELGFWLPWGVPEGPACLQARDVTLRGLQS